MSAPDLGSDFRRVRRATTVAAFGSGVADVALPLLAANVGRNAVGVAGVIVAQRLPWLLVGATGDRWLDGSDRRTVLGGLGALRAVTMVALGTVELAGAETLLMVYIGALVIGLAEAAVDDRGVELAEAVAPATSGGGTVGRLARPSLAAHWLGLPVGGVLFAVVPAAPFLLDALVFAVASLLVLLLSRAAAVRPVAPRRAPSRGAVSRTAGLRAVATAVAAVQAAGGAVAGIVVLVAIERYGLGGAGFGALLAAMAAGAVVGAWLAPSAARAVRTGTVAALCVAAGGYAVSGAFDDRLVGGGGLATATAGTMAALVLLAATRHRLARGEAAGPATRAVELGGWAAVPAGALLGGAAASVFDLRAPFAVAVACLVVAIVASSLSGSGPSAAVGAPTGDESR